MTKVTAGLVPLQGSDAQFRAWGSAFSAGLLAAGLTQTSDTGQINFTTVVRAGTNTDAGYEIWRFNDAGQATRPVFFKFRYGTGPAADRPRLYVDIGEGSNGAGTLTGAIKTDVPIMVWGNTGSGTLDVSICYNTTQGYLGIALTNIVGAGGNLVAQTMSLERLKDAAGAATTRGFAFVSGWPGNNIYYSTFASAWTSEGTNTIPAFWPVQAAGAASAGGTFLAGLTPLTGNGTHGPLERTLGFMVCGYGDFSSGEQFSTTRWDGNSHTYLATGTYGSANPTGNVPSQYARHAILWE